MSGYSCVLDFFNRAELVKSHLGKFEAGIGELSHDIHIFLYSVKDKNDDIKFLPSREKVNSFNTNKFRNTAKKI